MTLKKNLNCGNFKNGFMIVNGGKAEPLPENMFDIPSKEREEEITNQMIEDLKKYIEKQIKEKK